MLQRTEGPRTRGPRLSRVARRLGRSCRAAGARTSSVPRLGISGPGAAWWARAGVWSSDVSETVCGFYCPGDFGPAKNPGSEWKGEDLGAKDPGRVAPGQEAANALRGPQDSAFTRIKARGLSLRKGVPSPHPPISFQLRAWQLMASASSFLSKDNE